MNSSQAISSMNTALLMVHQIHTKPWKTNPQEIGKDLAISVSKVDKPVLLILPSPLSLLHTNYLSWTPLSRFRFLPPIPLKTTFKTTVLSKLPNPFLSTDSLKKKTPHAQHFLSHSWHLADSLSGGHSKPFY